MTTVSRREIDPRIRQRRIEVQRASGRRRLRRLMILGAGLLAIIVAVLVALSPVLDVDRISVAGAAMTPSPEIVQASGIAEGDAMVRLDVDEATRALEALPWVDEAIVRRDFPSGVRIEITERLPIGILRFGQVEALVDASGRVLGPLQLGHGDLATVELVAEIPAAGRQVDDDTRALLGLAEAVGSGIEGHSVAITQTDGGDASLLIDDAIEVRLGDAERTESKIRSVATMLDQVDLTCVRTIDVRIADQPVLTRDAPCQ